MSDDEFTRPILKGKARKSTNLEISMFSSSDNLTDDTSLQNTTNFNHNNSHQHQQPTIQIQPDPDEEAVQSADSDSEQDSDLEDKEDALEDYTDSSTVKLEAINSLFMSKRYSESDKDLEAINKKLETSIKTLRLYKKYPLLVSATPKNFNYMSHFKTFDVHQTSDFGIFNCYDAIKLFKRFGPSTVVTSLANIDDDVFASLCICAEPLENHFISSTFSGKLSLTDIEVKKEIRAYSTNKPVKQAASNIISKDHRVYSGFADGCIRIFDVRMKNSVGLLDLHMEKSAGKTDEMKKFYFNPITNLQINKENYLLSSCNNKVVLWDLRKGKTVTELSKPHKEFTLSKAIFLNRSALNALTIAHGDKKLQMWDMNLGELVQTVELEGPAVDLVSFDELGEIICLEQSGKSQKMQVLTNYKNKKLQEKIKSKDSIPIEAGAEEQIKIRVNSNGLLWMIGNLIGVRIKNKNTN